MDKCYALNEYFTSVSTFLNNKNSSNDYEVNITNLNQFIDDKIRSDVYFNIPFVTSDQVQLYIIALRKVRVRLVHC